MFSKRPAPVIGKLTNPFMSGGTWDASPSPRSPLECKIISPRGPINCDLSGVGLGIVAAMEKYSNDKSQLLANKSSTRSDLVPVNPSRISSSKEEDTENKEEDRLEDYTLVTRNRPDNMRSTRLYYDWSDQIQKKDSDRRRSKWNQTGFVDFPNISADDFLSNCDMCKKKLHGKDIYMYRGEKGFCSPECRYKQIVIDEKKEKYRSDESTSTSTSRSVEVSDSFCQNGRILFTPEILAI